ncbi:MAG: PPOX class F420-dependent oxidoreductase [Mycobacteriaceae bacterium]|nr:PPOX class F420-dependent oxidoreductase [Mycobacterium sp.]NBP85053.1 PPOX class F420-dependent oxidoreductase [Mycobacteriaceae bacterium]NBQ41929.1 PPOX class F420-dependent oxidoreductase [Mycobacteriaceae bacterium]
MEVFFVAAFTQREVDYLRSQPLMRFASASPTGRPDVAAVVFEVDGDDIVTAGFDIAKTVRYRNVQANPRAAVVVDDLAAVEPWTPRGIKVRGRVRIEGDDSGQRFRITPEVIWSWGINDPGPGVPTMERRDIPS